MRSLPLTGLLLVALAGGSSATTVRPRAECVVPAKAGGGFDLTCRLAQAMLADDRNVHLTYLPGGIGAVAYTTMAAKRSTDATAIVAFSSGSLLNLAQGKFGPHSEFDAKWLAIVGTDYGAIAVRKDSSFRTLKDLADAWQAKPRSVAIGAGGTIGSQDWFKAVLLARAMGVDHRAMRYVAFEGGGDALAALQGGHVQVVTGDAAEVHQLLAGNNGVRLLAVLSERRLPGALAAVPTAREQGYDIVWPTARGLYLGPKVSDTAVREWSDTFQRAMATDQFVAYRTQHGLYPLSLTGVELQRFIENSMTRYRKLAKEFGLPTK